MSKQNKQALGAVGIAVLLGVGMFAVLLFGDSAKWAEAERKEKAAIANAKASLVKHVKNVLNDPDSFKLVSFDYKPDDMVGVLRYRAKNGFNATITTTITARFDAKGNLLTESIDTKD